jgi:serine/threonine protein kinase
VKDFKSGEKLPVWTSAPETLCRGKCSFASDVWMLGISLWSLLGNGRFPFDHFYGNVYNPVEIAVHLTTVMKFHDEPVPLKWCGGEPLAFRDLIQRCCSFNPEDRLSISSVVSQLADLSSNLSCSQRPLRRRGSVWNSF